jgi:hypothetical protein
VAQAVRDAQAVVTGGHLSAADELLSEVEQIEAVAAYEAFKTAQQAELTAPRNIECVPRRRWPPAATLQWRG